MKRSEDVIKDETSKGEAGKGDVPKLEVIK